MTQSGKFTSRTDEANPRHIPRILFVDHTATLSGGEIAMAELIEHLDRRQCKPVVLLFSSGKLFQKLKVIGVECHVLPLARSVINWRKDRLGLGALTRGRDMARIAKFVWRLVRFMRTERIDLVHTNSLKADLLGGLAAVLARKPLIWHVRDRIETDYLPAPAVYGFRWLCRWLPDFVMANSEATHETLQLSSRTPSAVVYSGVSHELIEREDDTMASADRNPDKHVPQIGLVGRIASWKGQDIFIRAAARVREQFGEAQFYIIGAPMFREREYERTLRHLAESLGLDGAIKFTGFSEDVHEWIRSFDVLVHASTTAEPFGKVVVEGMAAGKPIVATNGGGIPSIVSHGETGLLVPMADVDAMAKAIELLLRDPIVARQMGERGRQRVRERFTLDRVARQVEGIYERILS